MRWESQNDYLIHYGVKGQKHGVRRYQNDDGSLTAEGRDHYGVGEGDGRTGGMRTGSAKTGRAAGGPVSVALTTIAARKLTYDVRKRRTQKEIDKAGINKDKERITKRDIDDMATYWNKKERKAIIDNMKADPKLTYKKARKPVADKHNKKVARQVAGLFAAYAAFALAAVYNTQISNTLHKADDAVKRNKTVQSFMKNVKHRSMKNAVVLKSNEYSIDKRLGLPGR